MGDEDYIIKFGIHKGKCIKDIPASYMLFLWDVDGSKLYNPIIKRYIQTNLQRFKDEVNKGKWYNKE